MHLVSLEMFESFQWVNCKEVEALEVGSSLLPSQVYRSEAIS